MYLRKNEYQFCMKTFGVFHRDRNTFTFAGEPLAFHTDHYNCFLQKEIEELQRFIDAEKILVNSAQVLAFTQFTALFKKHDKWDIEKRKKIVEDYFSYCGFGKINIHNLQPKGGYVETDKEHYGLAWKRIHGERSSEQNGVAYFLMGFLCGATEAVHDIALGTFDAKQITCISKGDAKTRIDVFRGLRKKLQTSVGEGQPQVFESQPSSSHTSVNYTAIMDSILGDTVESIEDTGLIEKYGGNVTRHYANYSNLVCLRVLIELEKNYKREGLAKAKSIVIKSSQMSAFHLIGNLVGSKEWEQHISPTVNSTEDQLHGILAFINTLGWGKWEAEELNSSARTTFSIVSSTESNAFLKMVGKTKAPVCFFIEGMVGAIMNMVYNTKLTPNMELNKELFESIFKADNRYVVVEAKTRMMGEESDRFVVERKS